MPCDAATNGTLSTIDEKKPIIIVITLIFPMAESIKAAASVSTPVTSKAAMLNRIPKKNKTLGVSIFRKA